MIPNETHPGGGYSNTRNARTVRDSNGRRPVPWSEHVDLHVWSDLGELGQCMGGDGLLG